MDPELIIKLLITCVKYNLPRGSHVQQKEDVKIVFSNNFLRSTEFEQFCREAGITPGEFLLDINRPTAPPRPKSYLYISKDIEPEHLKYSVHKLKRESGALSDCLTDLVTLWNKDSSGKLKTHHKINEKMINGYLKVRSSEHPDNDRPYTHEDIRKAIKNYHEWALAAKNNDRVWLQVWDLSSFLRSNKAISEWCYRREDMIAKVGPQYFEEQPPEKTQEEKDRIKQNTINLLKEIKVDVDKGIMPVGEFLQIWNENKHLLDEEV